MYLFILSHWTTPVSILGYTFWYPCALQVSFSAVEGASGRGTTGAQAESSKFTVFGLYNLIHIQLHSGILCTASRHILWLLPYALLYFLQNNYLFLFCGVLMLHWQSYEPRVDDTKDSEWPI